MGVTVDVHGRDHAIFSDNDDRAFEGEEFRDLELLDVFAEEDYKQGSASIDVGAIAECGVNCIPRDGSLWHALTSMACGGWVFGTKMLLELKCLTLLH
jgi:hypothetical protein